MIFDRIRKKFVAFTPEEWVRQHLINYLISERGYPAMLLSVETQLKCAGLDKRSDLLVSNRNGIPLMLAECKAPDVVISAKVFEQISIYNQTLNAPFLIATNGLTHYCLRAATDDAASVFLKEIPDFCELEAVVI